MAKYMRVDMDFPPEYPRGLLAALQDRLSKLRRMSKIQLVSYAEKEFKLYLQDSACNGKTYLFKKVAYYEQKRITGLTERAVKNLATLDEPATIRAFQDEERKNQEGTTMATKKKGVKKTTKKGAKRESASAMFKELIMEGKLTDDQIFAKVQKKHGLDDNKRSYVSWYRNDLKKNGKKPPATKVSASAKKAAASKPKGAGKKKTAAKKKTSKKVSTKRTARSKNA